jgi:hypothetical protein
MQEKEFSAGTKVTTNVSKFVVTHLVKQQPIFFMEPEASLPCSQKPATGPYPEPAKSSSPHRSLHLNVILVKIYVYENF